MKKDLLKLHTTLTSIQSKIKIPLLTSFQPKTNKSFFLFKYNQDTNIHLLSLTSITNKHTLIYLEFNQRQYTSLNLIQRHIYLS